MKKFILFLVAFSVLNQCIDIDYCAPDPDQMKLDDTDCILEFLIENITDYDVSEAANDDDSRPQTIPDYQDFSLCIYYQELKIVTNSMAIVAPVLATTDKMVCKGFPFIIFSPPDAKNV
jgi:hypothetical protein